MTHFRLLGTVLLLSSAQACAIEASEPRQPAEAGEPTPQVESAAPTVARCERVDDLGAAATGILLHKAHPDASDAPCLGLETDRIASFGGRACTLVEPRGFSLSGCVDSYDCGGCAVELRSDGDYGFVVSGTGSDAACTDLAGEYALSPGQVCDAIQGHL